MGKLRILVLAAEPEGHAASVKRDLDFMRRAFEVQGVTSRVDLRPLYNPDLADAGEALAAFRPHILQFSGHGHHGLVLVDVDGKAEHFTEGALVGALRGIGAEAPRLIVLAACSSLRMARAATRFVDCALGVADRLGDLDAGDFLHGFYLGIAGGGSIEAAFHLGLSRMPAEREPRRLFWLESRLSGHDPPGDLVLLERTGRPEKTPGAEKRRSALIDGFVQGGLQAAAAKGVDLLTKLPKTFQRHEQAQPWQLSVELAKGHAVVLRPDPGESWHHPILADLRHRLGLNAADPAVCTRLEIDAAGQVHVMVWDAAASDSVVARYPLDQFVGAWNGCRFSMIPTQDPILRPSTPAQVDLASGEHLGRIAGSPGHLGELTWRRLEHDHQGSPHHDDPHSGDRHHEPHEPAGDFHHDSAEWPQDHHDTDFDPGFPLATEAHSEWGLSLLGQDGDLDDTLDDSDHSVESQNGGAFSGDGHDG